MDTLVLNTDGHPLSVLPLSAITWQNAIRLLILEKVFVIEEYDSWEVHSQKLTMKVPSIVMTTEYLKWNRVVKFNRSNIYLRDGFICQLCNERYPLSELTFDHVMPKKKGGVTCWENITTACTYCNSSKGDDETVVPKNMPYKPSYYELMAKRKSHPIYISDEKWKLYLGWPEELYKLKKHNHLNMENKK